MIKKKWMSVALNRKQICFLDKLSKECKFSGGRTLSRTSILRAFLTVVKDMNVNVNNVKTEKELTERIVTVFQNQKGKR